MALPSCVSLQAGAMGQTHARRHTDLRKKGLSEIVVVERTIIARESGRTRNAPARGEASVSVVSSSVKWGKCCRAAPVRSHADFGRAVGILPLY